MVEQDLNEIQVQVLCHQDFGKIISLHYFVVMSCIYQYAKRNRQGIPAALKTRAGLGC